MKRATLILSILAIVLIIAGTALVVSAASGCTAATATAPASCSSGAAGNAALGGILNLVGYIATFVAWILGIIKTATLKRWGWMVLVLLLSPLGSLIYGAAGPDQPAA